jgi:hypothetical protein
MDNTDSLKKAFEGAHADLRRYQFLGTFLAGKGTAAGEKYSRSSQRQRSKARHLVDSRRYTQLDVAR